MKEGIDEPKKQPKEKKSSGTAIGSMARNAIAGDFLANEKIDKHIYFILFIVALAIVYIGLGNQVDAASRAADKKEAQIKELRAIYISKYRKLNEQRTAMQIKELIEKNNIDLKELKEPPFIISTDGNK
ncbi:MAG: FtsL-like putative cell division protein [Bacteroidetes bacterium]|nr:FtsL-like putative cell division protein [Bacteroidota bacterium]